MTDDMIDPEATRPDLTGTGFTSPAFTSPAFTSPAFTSPDGHTWELDTDHQSGPRTPMCRPLMEASFGAGIGDAFARIGAPLARGECCHVAGWSYLRMVPAGAPDRPGSGGPPPDIVLRIVSRLHPELRRRERTARAALAGERWMDDVEGWWIERPRWEATFRAQQHRDLTALDDHALAGAVDEAWVSGGNMLERHFQLITPGVGIGLALVACADHGIDAATAADALRGCSASTSAPRRALRAIVDALADHGIRGDAVPGDIATLRASAPDVARLVDDYLDRYGWLVLGDDLHLPTLAERPQAMVVALHAVALGPRDRMGDGDPDAIDALLPRVEAGARSEVERLLRQAGKAYAMLDDNSAVTCWGMGIIRRAVLEAATRLVATGRITESDHVWCLNVDELVALLRGGAVPGPAEVAARHDDHLAAHDVHPPRVIGPPSGPPPDPALFPRGMRIVTRAIGTYLDARFPDPDERAATGHVDVDARTVATGHGVGDRSAMGRAVVALTVHDAFERLTPGDVLVCPVTNPAYNVLFPIAGAVVTAAGGPLGHTAVTAREVGIPAVVGIGDLAVIPDGAVITVTGCQ